MPLKRSGSIALTFKDALRFPHVHDPILQDLSAVASVGETLFVSCDETAGIDRLRRLSQGRWGDHQHVNLGAFFDLPGGPGGEMDIEGLAHDGGWLWAVGSHSLKRKAPKRYENDPAAALDRMTDIEREPNRFFLGRVPLVPAEDGALGVTGRDNERRAQSFKLSAGKSALETWLADDPHLGSSLAIPSKENGFDIEGIAVSDERVWLGLRGPALRGHAVIVELSAAPKARKPGQLKARRIEGRRRYRKHLLPTRGLGVRDLLLDGEDMLMLLGPTMAHRGRACIARWKGAARHVTSGVVAEADVDVLIDLPTNRGGDKAEGLARLPSGEVLVIYDDPVAGRVSQDGLTLRADLFSRSDG